MTCIDSKIQHCCLLKASWNAAEGTRSRKLRTIGRNSKIRPWQYILYVETFQETETRVGKSYLNVVWLSNDDTTRQSEREK